MRVSNIILKPVITEKSMAMAPDNKYIFEVNYRASKGSVADEIKRVYGVDVVDVQTLIMPGKKRRVLRTRKFTKTGRRKKAIIKLKEGQKIDIVGN